MTISINARDFLMSKERHIIFWLPISAVRPWRFMSFAYGVSSDVYCSLSDFMFSSISPLLHVVCLVCHFPCIVESRCVLNRFSVVWRLQFPMNCWPHVCVFSIVYPLEIIFSNNVPIGNHRNGDRRYKKSVGRDSHNCHNSFFHNSHNSHNFFHNSNITQQ